jgi:hypothetical protein
MKMLTNYCDTGSYDTDTMIKKVYMYHKIITSLFITYSILKALAPRHHYGQSTGERFKNCVTKGFKLGGADM